MINMRKINMRNKTNNTDGLRYIALAILIVAGLYFRNEWIIYLGVGLLLLPFVVVLSIFLVVAIAIIILYIRRNL